MAEIGDVLYLKCGSQPMVVTQLASNGEGTVQLRWMAGSSMSTCDLPEACLIPDDPGPQMQKARADVMAQLFPVQADEAHLSP